SRDSPIVEDWQSLDLTLEAPPGAAEPFRLHRTAGSTAGPGDFAPSVEPLEAPGGATLSGASGNSSGRDLPFFDVESGGATTLFAIGWSGQWQARLGCPRPRRLPIRSRPPRTHFLPPPRPSLPPPP